MSKVSKNKYIKLNFKNILLMVICIYFVSVFCFQQYKINEYKVKENYYVEAISEINNEKAEYDALVEDSDTSEYVEKVAREKLGLVKPYEKIFIDVNK